MKKKEKKKIGIITPYSVGDGKYPPIISTNNADIYILESKNDEYTYKIWDTSYNFLDDATIKARKEIKNAITTNSIDMLSVFLTTSLDSPVDLMRDTKKLDETKLTYYIYEDELFEILKYGDFDLKSNGNIKANRIVTECGGRDTLYQILKNYMK